MLRQGVQFIIVLLFRLRRFQRDSLVKIATNVNVIMHTGNRLYNMMEYQH